MKSHDLLIIDRELRAVPGAVITRARGKRAEGEGVADWSKFRPLYSNDKDKNHNHIERSTPSYVLQQQGKTFL
jgi:hypothetical protein